MQHTVVRTFYQHIHFVHARLTFYLAAFTLVTFYLLVGCDGWPLALWLGCCRPVTLGLRLAYTRVTPLQHTRWLAAFTHSSFGLVWFTFTARALLVTRLRLPVHGYTVRAFVRWRTVYTRTHARLVATTRFIRTPVAVWFLVVRLHPVPCLGLPWFGLLVALLVGLRFGLVVVRATVALHLDLVYTFTYDIFCGLCLHTFTLPLPIHTHTFDTTFRLFTFCTLYLYTHTYIHFFPFALPLVLGYLQHLRFLCYILPFTGLYILHTHLVPHVWLLLHFGCTHLLHGLWLVPWLPFVPQLPLGWLDCWIASLCPCLWLYLWFLVGLPWLGWLPLLVGWLPLRWLLQLVG